MRLSSPLQVEEIHAVAMEASEELAPGKLQIGRAHV
jgi:hypothetical protein